VFFIQIAASFKFFLTSFHSLFVHLCNKIMGHLSLGASSKPQVYHKAHILGELVEVKKRLGHKDVKLSQLSQRLQRLEEAHGRQNQEEKEEWRLPNFDA